MVRGISSRSIRAGEEVLSVVGILRSTLEFIQKEETRTYNGSGTTPVIYLSSEEASGEVELLRGAVAASRRLYWVAAVHCIREWKAGPVCWLGLIEK